MTGIDRNNVEMRKNKGDYQKLNERDNEKYFTKFRKTYSYYRTLQRRESDQLFQTAKQLKESGSVDLLGLGYGSQELVPTALKVLEKMG